LIPGWYWVNETDPGSDWDVTNMTNYVEVLPGECICTHVEIINTRIPPGCSHTQGYWKTHSSYGPAAHPDPAWMKLPDYDSDGTKEGPDEPFFDTGYDYLDILKMPPKGGNAYIILAHQYIAAELNKYYEGNPSSLPSSIANLMTQAYDLLDMYDTNMFGIPRAQAISIASTLDDFNNGYLDWPHCDDLIIG
jgi:hypothetical protein